jgi:hypothetical protein
VFKVSVHRSATGSAAPKPKTDSSYLLVRAVMIASATFLGASL